mgnify:CR=1 FL=1
MQVLLISGLFCFSPLFYWANKYKYMNATDRPNVPSTFFDMRLNLRGWADDADNYKIVADLIPKTSGGNELINTLDEVNQILPIKKPMHVFDGTMGSLLYLIDNHGLDVNKITNPVLKEIVFKHLHSPVESAKTKMNLNRWSRQA